MTSPRRRAALLLRCYPRAWRERYGEELVAVLEESISERPRWIKRTVDVVHEAGRARARDIGLLGPFPNPENALRSGLGVTGAAQVGFVAAAVASLGVIWDVDQHRSFSASWGATWTGITFFEAAIVGTMLALVTLLPIVVGTVRGLIKARRPELVRPVLRVGVGAVACSPFAWALSTFHAFSWPVWVAGGTVALGFGGGGIYGLARQISLSARDVRLVRCVNAFAALGTTLVVAAVFMALRSSTPGWPSVSDPAQVVSAFGVVTMSLFSSLMILGTVRSFNAGRDASAMASGETT